MDNDNKQNGVIMPNETLEPVQPAQVQPASGTIAPTNTTGGQNSVTDQMITPPKPKKKATNKIILLALIVLVVFGIGYYSIGNKKSPVIKKNNNANKTQETEYKKLDTGLDWADEYSVEVQKFFKSFDSVDIAFIDLDFLGTPEMIVKYTEDKKTSLQIFSINSSTNVVSSSKSYPNSSIELIYSLYEGVSRFYVHIKNTDKYGTYTEANKIIAGTVYKPDIEATNDNQLNDFKAHYVVSDYDITYYEVKKASFAENYKTMLDRRDRYASEISEEKDKLNEANKDKVEKKEDSNDSLATAGYKLVYGKYLPDELHINDGSINPNIYINNDGTITIGEDVYRYEVNSAKLVLDNGTSIKIIGNDAFQLETDGGIIYRAENPINMTEDEKKAVEREIKDERNRQKEEEKKKKNGTEDDSDIIS